MGYLFFSTFLSGYFAEMMILCTPFLLATDCFGIEHSLYFVDAILILGNVGIVYFGLELLPWNY